MRVWWIVDRGSWIGCARTVLLSILIASGFDARITNADSRPVARVGVLILAHGGSSRWNQAVRKIVREAKLSQPKEIVFGMGMHAPEVKELQQAIRNLEQRGVARIIAVPLLVSSHSEVMQQYQYLLGARAHGTWEGEIKPVAARVPVAITAALDDDPAVVQILLQRAQAISRRPQEERLVLVAHGPVSDEHNAAWLTVMDRIGQQLQRAGGFREVVPVTLRDDAAPEVVARATEQLRAVVQAGSQRGRVLVVPLLISVGGIEEKISQRLNGLSYVQSEEVLLPHPALAQWIAQQVAQAAQL